MTREQRHEVYVKALELFDEGYGLCRAIRNANRYLKKIMENPWPYDEMNKYKEIYKHKPRRAGMFWFPLDKEGLEKRISILKQAIEETKPLQQ